METPALYGVEYTVLDPLPARLVENEPLLIALQLRNTGLTPWLTTGYPVMLVVRWKTLDGSIVQELPWQSLPRPVPCGDAITIEFRLTAPVVAGEYVFTIELVEHMIAWFHERGVAPFCSPITVEPPRNPRITIINGNCLANDAVGTHVAAQVQALAEAGFQPLLLTSFVDERLPRALRRFMVVVRPDEIINPTDCSRPFAEHFRRSAAIIVNYSTYYELVELIRVAQAPVLFDYHGVTPPAIWGIGQPGYEDVMRGMANVHLVQFADYAVAHSQYMVDELVATGLIAPSRVSVLPYPVIHTAAYAGPPDPRLQQQYGLAGKRVLLYVGRMARNKRIHVLVEALALIRARYPDTVLLLVGETGHAYAGYVAETRARAEALGLADAVIFTGAQNRDSIGAFYQLCDVFVTASIHEGFCMPVMEAMALGKPVVAAAATALPSTVGDAGLLFTPDDPVDLAQQVMRVLAAQEENGKQAVIDLDQARNLLRSRPIAFVTPRYGIDVLGGAERGAQSWAEQLVAHGFVVEVFTTNAIDLVGWRTASLPEVEVINGVTVRRFVADPIDPSGFHEVQMKAARGEVITRRDEERFMQHNLRSRALEEYIARHRDEYAAFIFTPYLFGTTYYAAKQAGDRAFHIPCLHDEPAAQFAIFREMLEAARGIFFNTPAEERLAREKLGLVNPFSTVLGFGFPDEPLRGDPARFRERIGLKSPFLLYSGRLEEGKNVPLLIEWFIAYKTAHPASDLKLVLTGKREIPIPDRSDIVHIGIVDRQVLTDAYAAALALCQLSLNESFSIVMMESWQQGRPVIVHADCAVTREHVERSGGGYSCNSVASFSAAIDNLLADPQRGAVLGERGRTYVQAHFSWSTLVDKMIITLASFLQPRSLINELAQRGIRRALDFTYARFEAHLIGLIQHLCHQSAGWQLFEKVQGRLAALANCHSHGGLANEHEPAPIMARARRWVDRLRQQPHPSAELPPVNGHQHEQHAVMQLVAELLDLLAYTRHEQRRLERELALLRDQMAIEKQNVS
ncbi:glycosyltransferase family 4 protein [Chloroflexus sp.]|uniref:glycosyltransferase family 4 protein n=1 Tax=Chloroflexus sp. TaxID=1904827 RepID=UPI00258D8AF1|nr:glycosyltransferase family 4 protein [Chloroflexus sp.]